MDVKSILSGRNITRDRSSKGLAGNEYERDERMSIVLFVCF